MRTGKVKFFNESKGYGFITDDETGKKIHIIKITLNEDKDKPVLFALAGMSHKSFVGTSTVILSKLNLLKEKFKEDEKLK